MSIKIGQVNDADVIKLAGLMQQKEILIRDMRNAIKRLKDNELMIGVTLIPNNTGQVNALRHSEILKSAIDSQSEWIIDRIYDTAIHSLETEIASLSEKVMKNLIESHKPY